MPIAEGATGLSQAASDTTHPVQLFAISAACVVDIVGLVTLNRHKGKQAAIGCGWSWSRRRNAFHLLMALLFVVEVWLDYHYPISMYMLSIKSYSFVFIVGLLDLYFSKTKGVPLTVILGACVWCSTVVLRQWLVAAVWPLTGRPVIVRDITIRVALVEVVRYVGSLPIVGLLTDLLFSPMHRLVHHPTLYKPHHKTHHEYTNNLTALTLYHGALFDDWFMSLTTGVGSFLYVCLLSLFGLEAQAFSNVSVYLNIFNLIMSHAHDVRCARLMAPVPDSVNVAAYHYVHHLSPSNNFGLTKPSDRLWDWLLGVQTIRKLEDFIPAAVETTKSR